MKPRNCNVDKQDVRTIQITDFKCQARYKFRNTPKG